MLRSSTTSPSWRRPRGRRRRRGRAGELSSSALTAAYAATAFGTPRSSTAALAHAPPGERAAGDRLGVGVAAARARAWRAASAATACSPRAPRRAPSTSRTPTTRPTCSGRRGSGSCTSRGSASACASPRPACPACSAWRPTGRRDLRRAALAAGQARSGPAAAAPLRPRRRPRRSGARPSGRFTARGRRSDGASSAAARRPRRGARRSARPGRPGPASTTASAASPGSRTRPAQTAPRAGCGLPGRPRSRMNPSSTSPTWTPSRRASSTSKRRRILRPPGETARRRRAEPGAEPAAEVLETLTIARGPTPQEREERVRRVRTTASKFTAIVRRNDLQPPVGEGFRPPRGRPGVVRRAGRSPGRRAAHGRAPADPRRRVTSVGQVHGPRSVGPATRPRARAGASSRPATSDERDVEPRPRARRAVRSPIPLEAPVTTADAATARRYRFAGGAVRAALVGCARTKRREAESRSHSGHATASAPPGVDAARGGFMPSVSARPGAARRRTARRHRRGPGAPGATRSLGFLVENAPGAIGGPVRLGGRPRRTSSLVNEPGRAGLARSSSVCARVRSRVRWSRRSEDVALHVALDVAHAQRMRGTDRHGVSRPARGCRGAARPRPRPRPGRRASRAWRGAEPTRERRRDDVAHRRARRRASAMTTSSRSGGPAPGPG